MNLQYEHSFGEKLDFYNERKINMGRIRIKNKLRFITFLLVMFTLLSALCVSVFNIGKVYSKSEIEYSVYVVDNGETLWDIANKNNPENKDIRKVVYEIQKYNNIGNVVNVGQEIKIPL